MTRVYANRQVNLVLPYLADCKNVLDFGCGDLSLLGGLQTVYPAYSFTGVDVVDSGARIPGVTFTLYDGNRLPFPKQSFDATVAYHVLHHCEDPRVNLAEIVRVTRKRILLIEPVVRWGWERPFMKLADHLANGWRSAAIPMPFTFQTRDTWRRWIDRFGWSIEKEESAGVLPSLLPIGKTVLFSLTEHS